MTRIQSLTERDDNATPATGTPLDIIASLSLSPGNYLAQNVGDRAVFLSEQTSTVADPTTLDAGHRLFPNNFIQVTVRSGRLLYAWAEGDSLLAVTDSP